MLLDALCRDALTHGLCVLCDAEGRIQYVSRPRWLWVVKERTE